MLNFIEKLSERFNKYEINTDQINLIYDEESYLSKFLWEEVLKLFPQTRFLKIQKDRIWKELNDNDKIFINSISGICFLFFSDKGLDFKSYLNWRKLRDYLLFSKGIYTTEVWRLKYFDTEILQENMLFCLSESVSEDMEKRGLLFEEKIISVKNISINDSLFYTWDFEDIKYNFWLYMWEKNSLKWSLYPVWEVLLEPKDLSKANWKIQIYAFPDIENKMIYLEEKSYVYIENWYLVNHELWEEFDKVLDKIRFLEPDNDWIIVREMGFSINKNIKREFLFLEISRAEKTYGYHISLWWRYWVYNALNKVKNQELHVDIMVELDNIKFDNELIYSNWKYFFD